MFRFTILVLLTLSANSVGAWASVDSKAVSVVFEAGRFEEIPAPLVPRLKPAQPIPAGLYVLGDADYLNFDVTVLAQDQIKLTAEKILYETGDKEMSYAGTQKFEAQFSRSELIRLGVHRVTIKRPSLADVGFVMPEMITMRLKASNSETPFYTEPSTDPVINRIKLELKPGSTEVLVEATGSKVQVRPGSNPVAPFFERVYISLSATFNNLISYGDAIASVTRRWQGQGLIIKTSKRYRRCNSDVAALTEN